MQILQSRPTRVEPQQLESGEASEAFISAQLSYVEPLPVCLIFCRMHAWPGL